MALCALVLLGGCETGERYIDEPEAVLSDIQQDEHVVFFHTSGWLDEARQEWHLPVHGWVYEPEDSTSRKALFAEILDDQFELAPTDETEANFTRRVNLLIADNERDKTIVISLAGRSYVLPASSENGHFMTTLVLPVDEAEKFEVNGLIGYLAVAAESDTRTFTGEIRLVDPAGLSIISDIDDTVKITGVTERKRLLEHTFLLDFTAAPGMAKLYDEWSGDDVSFHFVSSSPWQLYSPLREFLDASGFPWATFNLKAFRFRDETLLNLFKKGTETKPVEIEAILATYPGRKFVLVGDSGEQDPEVYAQLLRKHPHQILQVLIRNVTDETADNERFSTVFESIEPDRWVLFDDPQSLALPDLQP
jgi:phosphatidate phosphatase APP1